MAYLDFGDDMMRNTFGGLIGLFFLAAFAALVVFIVYAALWEKDIPTPEEINDLDNTIAIDSAKAAESKTKAQYAFFASVLGMLVTITLSHSYKFYYKKY